MQHSKRRAKHSLVRHKIGVRPALREPGPRGDSVQGPVPNHLGKSKLSTSTRLSALGFSLPKNPTLAGSKTL